MTVYPVTLSHPFYHSLSKKLGTKRSKENRKQEINDHEPVDLLSEFCFPAQFRAGLQNKICFISRSNSSKETVII